MADQRDIDIRFARAFNNAKALHDDDLLDECVEKAHELLEDPAILPFHRMKTLLLLGSALEDLNEAFDCREESDALWKLIRSWHPEGQNSDVDQAMAEVHTSLDQLAEAISNEEQEEHDLEDDDFVIVDTHDDQVADTQAMIQRMEINEDDVDMDSGGADVAAGSASQVQVQLVQELLPSTEKQKPPHPFPKAMNDC